MTGKRTSVFDREWPAKAFLVLRAAGWTHRQIGWAMGRSGVTLYRWSEQIKRKEQELQERRRARLGEYFRVAPRPRQPRSARRRTRS